MLNRVFVCGDTHGSERDTKKLNSRNFPEQRDLTKDDVLIQLGDFGWIWHPIGKNKEQEYWLNWLGNKNYTLAVVPGNHENYDIIDNLPWTKKWDNDVQYYEILNGNRIYFLKRGAIYNINGRKILAIGGAVSIDKEYRTEGISWWAREDINYKEQEFCLNEIDEHNRKVDYILTHTCPRRYIGEFAHFKLEVDCPTANFLDEIDNLVEFKEWHFGHMHMDWTHKAGDEGNQDSYTCHYHKISELK